MFVDDLPARHGLSLVAIFLLGLLAVVFTAVVETRREAARQADVAFSYAFRLLANRLAEENPLASTGDGRKEQRLRELTEFAASGAVTSLRVLDSTRRVLVSLKPDEIGQIAAETTSEDRSLSTDALLEFLFGPRRQPVFVMRIASSGGSVEARADAGEIGVDGAYFLEAQRSNGGAWNDSFRLPVTTSGVGLVIMGALLAVYHNMRRQLRGTLRVADQLRSRKDRITEDLSTLRITDALDIVATTWNQLIDAARGWLSTVQQTSATDELARALQQSGGGTLAEALHAIPEGMMLLTQEVRIEYVNATICRLFCWKMEEARQWTLPEARAQGIGEAVLKIVRESLQPDGTYPSRSETIELADEKNREKSCYRLNLFPLQRGHAPGSCFLFLRDVSQQVRADRAREDFVAQVTHELRTPLTNIRAYAETLASGMFDDPKVITDCYNVITKETRRLSRLVEDILSVSQLEVGSIELHMDQVDLRSLLNDGVRDVRGLADEKNIDIQLALPAKLESIRADRDKLAVVVNNLLGNAIKYTPKEGNVVVGCQVAAQSVVITVKDNGIGIDPADHARVFEKFQRGNDPEVTNEPGTGIGLYTAREIVRRHGGDIEVISEKRAGSTFMVRLPLPESRASSVTRS